MWELEGNVLIICLIIVGIIMEVKWQIRLVSRICKMFFTTYNSIILISNRTGLIYRVDFSNGNIYNNRYVARSEIKLEMRVMEVNVELDLDMLNIT